jgi:signal transduction histidine kinase
MIGAYAAQAAIALEFERVRLELRRSAVSAERDRIGRDLHELVIQLLFGIGLTLQGLESAVRDEPTRVALHGAVDALDRAIVDLRRYVFDLEPRVGSGPSLARDLTTIAASMAAGNSLRMDVDIDPAVADQVGSMAADVIQIAREAISNVIRHANADHCVVRLRAADRSIVFEIIDDGRGIARSRRRRTSARPSGGHGLANIRARAETFGGEVEIGPGDGGGTRLRISFSQ